MKQDIKSEAYPWTCSIPSGPSQRSHSIYHCPLGVNLLVISIFIAQRFDTEIVFAEETSLFAPPSKPTVRVHFSSEVDTLTLLRYAPKFFELATKKPEMRNK